METPNYNDASELWYSFRDEVMFRQRFFLNHPVLYRLGDIARTLETFIAPGRIYYRARIIDDNALKEHMLRKCYAPDRTEEERKWYHSKANKFKGLSKEGSYVPNDPKLIRDAR